MERIKCSKQSKAILIVICFVTHTVSANQQNDPLSQFEKLESHIRTGMIQSEGHIENGEFQAAVPGVERVIEGLEILEEAFMPLGERIIELKSKEESILAETKDIEKKRKDGNSAALNDVIRSQIGNREKTEKASKLVTNQLEKTNQVGSGSTNQPSASNKNETEILTEVQKLLDQSASFQTAAIAHLENAEFKGAIENESFALEKLNEALEKMRQNSQSGSQQNQQNQQNSSEQKESEPQNTDSNTQDSNNQQQPGKQEKNGESNEQKMSADEALKQLLKLRKQAEDEKKRREKKYGIQQFDGQIPVEKDW